MRLQGERAELEVSLQVSGRGISGVTEEASRPVILARKGKVWRVKSFRLQGAVTWVGWGRWEGSELGFLHSEPEPWLAACGPYFMFTVFDSTKESSLECHVSKSIHLELTKRNGVQLLKQRELRVH